MRQEQVGYVKCRVSASEIDLHKLAYQLPVECLKRLRTSSAYNVASTRNGIIDISGDDL